MIPNLPFSISITFIITTIVTLLLLYIAISASKAKHVVVLLLVLWLIIQAFLSLEGFYLNTTSFPPKFILAVFPMLLLIVLLFITAKGRLFIDSISLLYITWLNSVRIPVELVLYWLFLNKAVPQLMTFEGRNFDILAGITAPFVAYFVLTRKKLSPKFLLYWNFICLALLLNIVINAVLSAPFPFQQFAFDQPNIAILYFPFIWLPSFIVPAVLFGHLVSIRQLFLKRDKI